MQRQLRGLADRGLVLTRDLVGVGWTHRDVMRAVSQGALVRVRRGAYRLPWQEPERASFAETHRMAVRAALAMTSQPSVASHASACVVHQLPLWPEAVATVHLMRLAGRAPRPTRMTHVHEPVAGVVVTSVKGIPTVSAADAVVELGLSHGYDQHRVLMAADHALRSGRATSEQLEEALERHAGCRAIARVRAVVPLADARRESPAESFAAWLLHQWGIAVVPQVSHTVEGRTYQVDFQVEGEPVVIEIDGRVKYDPARDPDALWREKKREDALRASGLEVVRVTWSDLEQPEGFRARLAAARARARRLG